MCRSRLEELRTRADNSLNLLETFPNGSNCSWKFLNRFWNTVLLPRTLLAGLWSRPIFGFFCIAFVTVDSKTDGAPPFIKSRGLSRSLPTPGGLPSLQLRVAIIQPSARQFAIFPVTICERAKSQQQQQHSLTHHSSPVYTEWCWAYTSCCISIRAQFHFLSLRLTSTR